MLTYAKHEERDDGVGWTVPEPQGRAETVTEDDSHGDPEDSPKAEKKSLLNKVATSNH